MSRQPNIAIEYLKIVDLRPDPFNPRTISGEQLRALMHSIEEFGFVDPVVIRREDKAVIGGHQRLAAARRLGHVEVPVVQIDATTDEARLLNLALNRISGDWDEPLLSRLLAHLDAQDLDLSLTGFEDDELAGLLNSIEGAEKRDRPEAFDLDSALLEASAGGRVHPGDLWALGEHRLLCGDATRREDLSRLLGSSQADLCFTDPPYNVDYGASRPKGKGRRKIANDFMPRDRWLEFTGAWAANLLSAVDGALYIFMSCKEWPTVTRALEEAGGHWSTTIIWAKDSFTLGRSDYQRQYEPIWYGWREGAKHVWEGGRGQGDVWSIERPSVSDLHPTMKPVEIAVRAIENSSHPGGSILDAFAGSGTTVIAAERTGRRCFALELDPVYCAVAIARWEAFSGCAASKLEGT